MTPPDWFTLCRAIWAARQFDFLLNAIWKNVIISELKKKKKLELGVDSAKHMGFHQKL